MYVCGGIKHKIGNRRLLTDLETFILKKVVNVARAEGETLRKRVLPLMLHFRVLSKFHFHKQPRIHI